MDDDIELINTFISNIEDSINITDEYDTSIDDLMLDWDFVIFHINLQTRKVSIMHKLNSASVKISELEIEYIRLKFL